jgi:hypothetical protein
MSQQLVDLLEKLSAYELVLKDLFSHNTMMNCVCVVFSCYKLLSNQAVFAVFSFKCFFSLVTFVFWNKKSFARRRGVSDSSVLGLDLSRRNKRLAYSAFNNVDV